MFQISATIDNKTFTIYSNKFTIHIDEYKKPTYRFYDSDFPDINILTTTESYEKNFRNDCRVHLSDGSSATAVGWSITQLTELQEKGFSFDSEYGLLSYNPLQTPVDPCIFSNIVLTAYFTAGPYTEQKIESRSFQINITA